MSKHSPTNVGVALPNDVKPSFEANELLIKKFLKACKKEDLQKTFEKSATVRRFQTPRQKEREERRRNKERALREYREAERLSSNDKAPKKRKE